MKSTNFNEVLTRLYYILIWSDGNVNEKEISYGRRMASIVGIEEDIFSSHVKFLEGLPTERIYSEAMNGMKQLSRDQQILCIAWLCVIANADAFMDEEEWKIIYRIYHLELGLPLKDIMKAQQNLNKLVLKSEAAHVAIL